MIYKSVLLSVAIGSASLSSAFAASVTLAYSSYGKSELSRAQKAYSDGLEGIQVGGFEGFEGYRSWEDTMSGRQPIESGAGAIRSVSETNGSGRSSVNGGKHLQVRSGGTGADFGRQNTGTGGRNWLDSNDLRAMTWDVKSGDGQFDTLRFQLTDVGDIRGTDFTVAVSGSSFETVVTHLGRQSNGTINLFAINFDGLVSDARVTLSSNINDGFGIDDLTVGISSIPIPPAAALLFTGIASLAGLRNRRMKGQKSARS